MGFLATICQIPGVLQYPAPVHIYERQIPGPRELSIGQIPGGVPGGGWLLQELTHALRLFTNIIESVKVKTRKYYGRSKGDFKFYIVFMYIYNKLDSSCVHFSVFYKSKLYEHLMFP